MLGSHPVPEVPLFIGIYGRIGRMAKDSGGSVGAGLILIDVVGHALF
jgi:hypothetical protein